MNSSDLAAITFYNKRGDVLENYNKNLINDFNISRLPFMDLNTNNVCIGFMLISVCAKLISHARENIIVIFSITIYKHLQI